MAKKRTAKEDSIFVAGEVAEWFQSLGPRYRMRMNNVLRAYMKERLAAKKRRAPKPKKPTR